MKKKTLFAALAVLVSSTVAMAGQQLVINGEAVAGKTVSSISFSGDNAILKYADNTTETYDMEVVVVTFDGETGNTSIKNYISSAGFELSGAVEDEMTIKGLTAGEQISVYSLNGRCEMSAKATAEEMTIDASGLSRGMHLIKVGTQVVKFIKK